MPFPKSIAPFSLVLLLLVSPLLCAQNRPEDLNQVYRTMAAAYERLDPDLMAQVYSPTTRYLPPGDDRGILVGREAVVESFASFFQRVRERGERARIAFKLVHRVSQDALASDVGFYALTVTAENGEQRISYGKFATVLRPSEGRWMFEVDAYSAATPEAATAPPALLTIGDFPQDQRNTPH